MHDHRGQWAVHQGAVMVVARRGSRTWGDGVLASRPQAGNMISLRRYRSNLKDHLFPQFPSSTFQELSEDHAAAQQGVPRAVDHDTRFLAFPNTIEDLRDLIGRVEGEVYFMLSLHR